MEGWKNSVALDRLIGSIKLGEITPEPLKGQRGKDMQEHWIYYSLCLSRACYGTHLLGFSSYPCAACEGKSRDLAGWKRLLFHQGWQHGAIAPSAGGKCTNWTDPLGSGWARKYSWVLPVCLVVRHRALGNTVKPQTRSLLSLCLALKGFLPLRKKTQFS